MVFLIFVSLGPGHESSNDDSAATSGRRAHSRSRAFDGIYAGLCPSSNGVAVSGLWPLISMLMSMITIEEVAIHAEAVRAVSEGVDLC